MPALKLAEGGVRVASLSDALDLDAPSAYLTANQALVRLLLMQSDADRSAGLRTAGFVSGYRGSPLGGIDQALWRAEAALSARDIRFQPGLNEELAATAVWGSQQAGLYEKARFDGVFSLWYGKGPGVDRAGDAIKHANLAGTAKHGGTLLLAGDDHAAKSSTTAHQSEQALIAAGVPILNPSSIDELLHYGLFGLASSRFSGLWVGLKCLTAVMDSAISWRAAPAPAFVRPTFPDMPAGGLNIRASDSALAQEERLHRWKLPAFLEMARANGLDRATHATADPRLVIVTTGKAWLDTIAALDRLGFDEARRVAAGIAVYKVAVTWPLDSAPILALARRSAELVFVEEKAGLIEDQLLAAWARAGAAPIRFSGKRDPDGKPLFDGWGELDAGSVAAGLDRRLRASGIEPPQALAPRAPVSGAPDLVRAPYFCSGCPHNSSTRLPEGSKAGGGIGCHGLAVWNDAEFTLPFTQMGGEGSNWIGRAPFVEAGHIFQNLGDGTYTHSGVLAVRGAVAARTNITFKLLYNHAVAMTGGQTAEGELSVQAIAAQLVAEGVGQVVVVADDPARYGPGVKWPEGVTVRHRDELGDVQRLLRDIPGVTALIYDQGCATELRRLRKRGLAPAARASVFINDLVCEGCGDCGAVSNCVAIQPLETPQGRKRTIDQTMCNADLSCLKGFCPSFVTISGGEGPVRPVAIPAQSRSTPPTEPALPQIDGVWNILLTGIGGTGVVTQAALLGMAAHLEGKPVRVVDQTGMAQKNGGVTSQVMIAADTAQPLPAAIAAGALDVLIANDLAVAATEAVMQRMSARTRGVANLALVAPGAFTRDRDLRLDGRALLDRVHGAGHAGGFHGVDVTALSRAHLGDSASANVTMLGMAWQQGLIPLAHASIRRAIELNGVAVKRNLEAFEFGRSIIADQLPDATDKAAPPTLDDIMARHALSLTAYQNAGYARQFERWMGEIRLAEQTLSKQALAKQPMGDEPIARAAAASLARLMAYKDEYEVARLLTDPDRLDALRATAGAKGRLRFHLAPPLLARTDPRTGHPRKLSFGAWVIPLLGLLAALKPLRGTALDVFSHTAERRLERDFAADYVTDLLAALAQADATQTEDLVHLAGAPLAVKGFGHVKHAAYLAYCHTRGEIHARLGQPPKGARA